MGTMTPDQSVSDVAAPLAGRAVLNIPKVEPFRCVPIWSRVKHGPCEYDVGQLSGLRRAIAEVELPSVEDACRVWSYRGRYESWPDPGTIPTKPIMPLLSVPRQYPIHRKLTVRFILFSWTSPLEFRNLGQQIHSFSASSSCHSLLDVPNQSICDTT